MTTLWNGFKDWLYSAWISHPIYTIMLGGGCFLLGAFIL